MLCFCWYNVSVYLTALDSLGVGHDNGLLVADLLNLILTDSGVQKRGDNGGNNRVAVVAKQLKKTFLKREIQFWI